MNRNWLRALLPLVVVFVLGVVFNGDGAFFEWQTHRALLREISVHGILACALTLVIIAGGIDLSVGSVLALAAVTFSWLSMHRGVSSPLALALVLVLGALCGAVSGALVGVARIQAFIVTLAMMVFARGLAKLISGGQKISHYFAGPDGHFVSVEPPALFALIDRKVFGGQVSVVTLIFVACAALSYVVLARLRVGRYLYALGGNWDAARLAGVPVRQVTLLVYAVAGLFSAIAGVCQAAQETQGDPETGLGYELDAIAMVVLGGTSLSGGRGGIGLTLIGALSLGYLQKILSLNAYSTEARLMLTGVVVIGAVLFQRRARAT
ncbi:MAG: ABC transporter permease [Polyangiaceae bacterium]